MEIAVIGTGYVGLVTGVCFSELGHRVSCIDIDAGKIAGLQKGISPIHEPGLGDYLTGNLKSGRLHFSTNFSSLRRAKAIFLAVGTPPGKDGGVDITYLYASLDSAMPEMAQDCVVVVKSTVPVGQADILRDFIKEKTGRSHSVVSNPEFLREGTAVEDFMRPDRVVIGLRPDDGGAHALMVELYTPLVRQGNPLCVMSNRSAELTKYASNGLLASRISFINEIANLCEATGADIDEVREGMSRDKRIGRHFLYPGPGFGGSCFPKDILALESLGQRVGVEVKMIKATREVNEAQKQKIASEIIKRFGPDLSGKIFALWGVAFKANTDDVRESAAMDLARALHRARAQIHFYDPVASENFKKALGPKVCAVSFRDKYEALEGAQALILLTEWREFSHVDLTLVKKNLAYPLIVDGRNLLSRHRVSSLGLEYKGLGRC